MTEIFETIVAIAMYGAFIYFVGRVSGVFKSKDEEK